MAQLPKVAVRVLRQVEAIREVLVVRGQVELVLQSAAFYRSAVLGVVNHGLGEEVRLLRLGKRLMVNGEHLDGFTLGGQSTSQEVVLGVVGRGE